MKTRVIFLVFVLVGATIGLALASLAEANFNAATGFSGRHGFTCTSCHNVPDRGPLGDDEIYDSPARVTVDGLPDAWVPGGSYRLNISVTGGPPALPNPAPQGGFEIEANRGSFGVPEDMAELIDVYAEGAVTYTVAGTQVRDWAVLWRAPLVTSQPQPITFWVAGMAANGNHVVAGDASAGGELGDSVDNITLHVAPSQAAYDAWELIRLDPPTVDSVPAMPPFTPIRITGSHSDADATHVGFRIDDGSWGRIATEPIWAIQVDGLGAGTHALWVRSETADRVSDPVEISLTIDESATVPKTTPAVGIALVVGALAMTRRRFP